MPTRDELIAHNRDEDEVRIAIGADRLVYQDVASMLASVSDINPALSRLEASCFTGVYVTGDISPEYLDRLEGARHKAESESHERGQSQLNLQLDGA